MTRQMSETCGVLIRRGIDDGMLAQEFGRNTGSPQQCAHHPVPQPSARKGKIGLCGMADRPVVPRKLVSASRGKGP